MHDVSPAIERAWAAARRRAGVADATLADLLLGLLEEDEGRPAALLGQLGLQLEAIRDAVAATAHRAPATPSADAMYALAREESLHLRAEPNPTTEFLFLASLACDGEYATAFGEQNLTPERLRSVLRAAAPDAEPHDFGGETFTVPDSHEVRLAARAIDANLNRAREALRVLDDYSRFVLGDTFLTQQWKRLRHRLAEASAKLPSGELLASRNTLQDVGTALSAPGEYTRHTPAAVAAANAKRLQEALRSLEEFGKILSPEFARIVEQLRYECYTLERSLVRHGHAIERLGSAKLYALLTGSQCSAALDWTIAEAALGGVDVVQMREKEMNDTELLERGRRLRKWTHAAGVLFIVNDRPDIARLVEADGVHLGQTDLPVAAARSILGPDALVGVSTHNLEQVRQAILDGADYLGVGPVFSSKTKSFDRLAGLEFVRQAMVETSLPAFALGGITLNNVQEVVAAGGCRIAVGAAIATADDPRSMALALRAAICS